MNEKNVILNKIFTGGYIQYNLEHEIKNFIKLDDGVKIAFINPYGNFFEIPNYIIHLIKSNYQKNLFEVVAISELSNEAINIE